MRSVDGAETETPHANPKPAPVPREWSGTIIRENKRTVVLGDPGFGKTWLLRYEARRIALEALQTLEGMESDGSLDRITIPIFLRLPSLASSSESFEQAILNQVCGEKNSQLRNWVQNKFETHQCVLFLDAWDEVSTIAINDAPSARENLESRLKQFFAAYPNPSMILTSRFVGYSGSPIPDVKELELISLEAAQVQGFIKAWFPDPAKVKACIDLVDASPPLSGLSKIPLMLTLLCRTCEDVFLKQKDQRPGKISLPTRRVEFYEDCLQGLLHDWYLEHKREAGLEGSQPRRESVLGSLLELLQDVSLRLILRGYDQFSQFKEKEIADVLLICLENKPGDKGRYPYLESRDPLALIHEFEKSGILTSWMQGKERWYLFLHRTFQEYLAASAIARAVEEKGGKGWKGKIPWLPGTNLTLLEWVGKKSWNPQWEQIFVLLAGELLDPWPLLKLVSDPTTDDVNKHRSMLCFRSIPETQLESRSWEKAKHVIERGFSLLRDEEAEVREATATVLAGFGKDSPEVRTALLSVLKDKYGDVRWEIAKALGGCVKDSPEICTALVSLLEDKNRGVRRATASALGVCVRVSPEVRTALLSLLEDKDEIVRGATAKALGSCVKDSPEVRTALLPFLKDEDEAVRWYTATALAGCIKESPEVCTYLFSLLLLAV